MRAWLDTKRSWLVVERRPVCAPELNQVEGLWSSLKTVESANLTADAGRGDRPGPPGHRPCAPDTAYSFLRYTGLTVSWTHQPDARVQNLESNRQHDI
jgi:hypothetical protein